MGDKFDIDFKLLPPELKIKLWVLALDADTGSVNLAYKPGMFSTSLKYNYGGSAEAAFGIRRFKLTLGYDPGKKDAGLGLVFRGFRFKATANTSGKSGGVSLGFGAPLLPYPWELASVFNTGGAGLGRVLGNSGGAANDPLAFYNLHSDDFSAVTKAVKLGQQIGKYKTQRFGAGLRLNYGPDSGLTIHGGALVRF